jgi:ribosomal protein L37AE/L43A
MKEVWYCEDCGYAYGYWSFYYEAWLCDACEEEIDDAFYLAEDRD